MALSYQHYHQVCFKSNRTRAPSWKLNADILMRHLDALIISTAGKNTYPNLCVCNWDGYIYIYTHTHSYLSYYVYVKAQNLMWLWVEHNRYFSFNQRFKTFWCIFWCNIYNCISQLYPMLEWKSLSPRFCFCSCFLRGSRWWIQPFWRPGWSSGFSPDFYYYMESKSMVRSLISFPATVAAAAALT